MPFFRTSTTYFLEQCLFQEHYIAFSLVLKSVDIQFAETSKIIFPFLQQVCGMPFRNISHSTVRFSDRLLTSLKKKKNDFWKPHILYVDRVNDYWKFLLMPSRKFNSWYRSGKQQLTLAFTFIIEIQNCWPTSLI